MLLNICRECGLYYFQKRRMVKLVFLLLPVFLYLFLHLSFSLFIMISHCLSFSGCCRVDWRFCHACFDRPGRAQVPTVWQLSSNPAAYCCTNAPTLAHIHTHTYMACMSIRQRWGDRLSVFSISFSFALFTSLPLSLAGCVLEGWKV